MNYSCLKSALRGEQSSDTIHLGLPEKWWAGLAYFPGETQRVRDANAERHHRDTSTLQDSQGHEKDCLVMRLTERIVSYLTDFSCVELL